MNDKKNNFLETYNLPDPVCLYKWNWSTNHLMNSTTCSCHRVQVDHLTAENYDGFHNTPKKITDRQLMIEGKWPTGGCEYCKHIEDAGGISDRLSINSWGVEEDLVPKETIINNKHTNLTPTMVEVYFSNLCNMGCIYCSSMFSTVLEAEDRKFNLNPDRIQHIDKYKKNYPAILEAHWKWFKDNGKHLKRYNILGGEPFYQKEFETNIDLFFDYPCPDLEVAIFTNLKVEKQKMITILDKVSKLIELKHLKKFKIFFSIDCWGPQAEYIRYGLNLKKWEENFNIILNDYKFIEIIIHSTLTSLSMPTYPILCKKASEWNKVRPIYQSASFADGRPHMHVDAFPNKYFEQYFDEAIENSIHDNFKMFLLGFKKRADFKHYDLNKIKQLKNELDSIDSRRGTNWKQVWPWLDQYEV